MALITWHKKIIACLWATVALIACSDFAFCQNLKEYELIPVARINSNATGNGKAKVDTVYYDEQSQTVDLFFVASIGQRQFWDFYDKNLVIKEVIGKDTLSLPIVFQGKIKDPALFGERDVYQLKTRSSRNMHRELRVYVIKWQSPDQNRITLGQLSVRKNWSVFDPFSLQRNFSFGDVLVLSLLILALILLILSELLPKINILIFKRKYVVPFSQVQKNGDRKLNPITGKPLQPNDLVVHRCNREICNIPLHIWEHRKYQCFHCPDKCDGDAHIWTRKFFHQKGGSKKLNWLWFGAAGGTFAWLINELVAPLFSSGLFENMVLGFSIGLAYTFMLSWVEELGQGRTLSLGRILLRTLAGSIMGALLFWIVSLINSSNLFNAIAWLIFCVLLGAIVSIRSSIDWKRGALSGLIAGAVSGLIYYLFPLLFPNPEASLVKMITLMIAGAVLGQGVIQVVKQLEKIELQVVAPAYRSGMAFALDNFLKTGKKVLIGKDMKSCTVRVKWDDDYVLAHHAELRMANNKVYIKALGDAEIWVDENPIQKGKDMLVTGGEMIRLGRNSKTVFKYLQKA